MRGPALIRQICDTIGPDCAVAVMAALEKYAPHFIQVCQSCGLRFIGRGDALTCSGTCRQRLRRSVKENV